MSTRIYRARWLFPVASPPLEHGEVAVADGRIVAVGRRLAADVVTDLGDAALLPGLVNAHVHLEFSELATPLGSPGMSFPAWIREVVAHRRAHPASRTAAVQAGLAESAAAGVAVLGDIASPGWPPKAYRASPVESTIFQEQLALAKDRVEEKLAEARRHLATSWHGLSAGDEAPCTGWKPVPQLGISPHAPYTVHPELFAKLVGLAAEQSAPLAFHLAESLEELELLAAGCGPFRDLLEELHAWDGTAIPHGTRPLDYLQELANANVRGLVIHGNYLREDEHALLAAHAKRLSVVYCPRTHAYFGHAPYPLAATLARGVHVALGTDSRASNPDLNLWAEMLHIARRHPSVPLAKVLELGTLAGAVALGRDDEYGTIEVGKLAAFCEVDLPQCQSPRDPHERLFEAGANVRRSGFPA